MFIFVLYLSLKNSQSDFDVEIIPADQADFIAFKSDSVQHEISFSENNPHKQVDYFYFDPNTLNTNGWIDLGFSEKQAQSIISYRQKIGSFKQKTDLKKVFVISEEKYGELEPYIQINAEAISAQNSTLQNINQATLADLESLPGIGEKTANRILNYRNSLGGFYSMTQLHEVYNLNEEMYQVLVDHFVADASSLQKININSASKDAIDKHPYIDFAATASILKKRETEKIQNLNFLLDEKLIDQSTLQQILPYISFEDW